MVKSKTRLVVVIQATPTLESKVVHYTGRSRPDTV